MGRFRTADDGPPIPYSDVKPERCEPAVGPKFILPGETEPRQCGVDPDMPPATDRPHYERDVNLGYAKHKRRP